MKRIFTILYIVTFILIYSCSSEPEPQPISVEVDCQDPNYTIEDFVSGKECPSGNSKPANTNNASSGSRDSSGNFIIQDGWKVYTDVEALSACER